MEIGGLSNYTMIGKDTISGDSLTKFPVAEGKIPRATTTVIGKPSNAFQILWIDDKGERRCGVIRAKKKEEEV